MVAVFTHPDIATLVDPPLRLRRKEGNSSIIKSKTLFPACGREGDPA
ncbi:MAG: hypothetical protein JWR50_942 [Mucilaginibacter sp.]|nr:hypothetical protein [Mucilaginibacter sp.]